MGFFGKKRGSEVIDLSDMYKRGILKEHTEQTRGIPESNSEGMVDFTSSSQGSGWGSNSGGFGSGSSSMGSGSSSSVSSGGGDDFLSGFAQASVNPSHVSTGHVMSNLRSARESHPEHSKSEVNELRIKLDDLNFKFDNLIDKVRELEEKLRRFDSY